MKYLDRKGRFGGGGEGIDEGGDLEDIWEGEGYWDRYKS